MVQNKLDTFKNSHLSQVGQYNELFLRIFANTDILEECGERGIRIMLKYWKETHFTTNCQKQIYTNVKSIYYGAITIDLCTTLLQCTDILIIDHTECTAIYDNTV